MSNKYIINSINGIWNSLGEPPEKDSGVGITITTEDTVLATGTGSLKSLLGFSDETKFIGQLSETTEISELIVLLPMSSTGAELEPPGSNTKTTTTIDCSVCNEEINTSTDTKFKNKLLTENLVSNKTENAKLFKIKEEIINKILGIVDYKNKEKKYSIFDFKKMLEDRASILNMNNNIVKLMFAMTNYYFPPHLNWLLNTSIDPIAMYAIEFKSYLNKNDLSNIWQGTMPQIATEPEEEEIEIEHFFDKEEIFGGYDINDIENLKISVFKCKKRASSNFNEYLLYETPKNNTNWYNYNWPYDNFSLVELLQVQVGEVHDFKNDGSLEDGVLKEEKTKTVVSGSSTYTTTVR